MTRHSSEGWTLTHYGQGRGSEHPISRSEKAFLDVAYYSSDPVENCGGEWLSCPSRHANDCMLSPSYHCHLFLGDARRICSGRCYLREFAHDNNDPETEMIKLVASPTTLKPSNIKLWRNGGNYAKTLQRWVHSIWRTLNPTLISSMIISSLTHWKTIRRSNRSMRWTDMKIRRVPPLS